MPDRQELRGFIPLKDVEHINGFKSTSIYNSVYNIKRKMGDYPEWYKVKDGRAYVHPERMLAVSLELEESYNIGRDAYYALRDLGISEYMIAQTITGTKAETRTMLTFMRDGLFRQRTKRLKLTKHTLIRKFNERTAWLMKVIKAHDGDVSKPALRRYKRVVAEKFGLFTSPKHQESSEA